MTLTINGTPVASLQLALEELPSMETREMIDGQMHRETWVPLRDVASLLQGITGHGEGAEASHMALSPGGQSVIAGAPTPPALTDDTIAAIRGVVQRTDAALAREHLSWPERAAYYRRELAPVLAALPDPERQALALLRDVASCIDATLTGVEPRQIVLVVSDAPYCYARLQELLAALAARPPQPVNADAVRWEVRNNLNVPIDSYLNEANARERAERADVAAWAPYTVVPLYEARPPQPVGAGEDDLLKLADDHALLIEPQVNGGWVVSQTFNRDMSGDAPEAEEIARTRGTLREALTLARGAFALTPPRAPDAATAGEEA